MPCFVTPEVRNVRRFDSSPEDFQGREVDSSLDFFCNDRYKMLEFLSGYVEGRYLLIGLYLLVSHT